MTYTKTPIDLARPTGKGSGEVPRQRRRKRCQFGLRPWSLLLIMSAGLALAADDRVAVAEAAAAASAASEPGKQYNVVVGQAFGTAYGATIGSCAKESKRPDISNFSLYLRVWAGGAVEEALVKPETNVSVCLRARLAGWKVPQPPSGGFWVKIGVNLKPQRR